MLLNYSVAFLHTNDNEGRQQAIHGLATAIGKEVDLTTLLRMSYGLGNLCHKNEGAQNLAKSLDIKFPPYSKITGAEGGDKEFETRSRETIREIADFVSGEIQIPTETEDMIRLAHSLFKKGKSIETCQ